MKNSGAHFIRVAELLYDEGRLDAALTEVQNGISLDPKDFSGIVLRAMLYEHFERWEESLRDYETAIQLVRGPKALSDLSPDEKYNAAFLYKYLSDAYWRAACRDDNHVEWAKALDAHEKALDLDGSNAIWWAEYGRLLRQLDRKADAVIAFRRSLSIDPDLGEAKESLKEALGDIGRDHFRAARILKDDGNPAEALRQAEQGLEYQPHDPLLLTIRASALFALKRTAESRSLAERVTMEMDKIACQRALTANEKYAHKRAFGVLGGIAAVDAWKERNRSHRKELWNESKNFYLKGLAIDDRIADYWYGLARANRFLGNGAESVSALQHLVSLESTTGAYSTLFREAVRNLNFKVALDAWKRLLEMEAEQSGL